MKVKKINRAYLRRGGGVIVCECIRRGRRQRQRIRSVRDIDRGGSYGDNVRSVGKL